MFVPWRDSAISRATLTVICCDGVGEETSAIAGVAFFFTIHLSIGYSVTPKTTAVMAPNHTTLRNGFAEKASAVHTPATATAQAVAKSRRAAVTFVTPATPKALPTKPLTTTTVP